jgi:TolA-binding protein
MYSREEILKIYNTGSEAVISLVQRLETQMKAKDILIEQLREQIKLLKDQENMCNRLEKQIKLIDSQLEMLDRLNKEE